MGVRKFGNILGKNSGSFKLNPALNTASKLIGWFNLLCYFLLQVSQGKQWLWSAEEKLHFIDVYIYAAKKAFKHMAALFM